MRWVYKTVQINVGEDHDHSLIERKLNELGAQGWELVSSIRASYLLVVCVLKKQQDASEETPPHAAGPTKKDRKRKAD
jgi:hypothetical protein